MDWWVILLLVILWIGGALFFAFRLFRREEREYHERMEAFFKASFPDLQPHFHPRNVHEYVGARRARHPSREPWSIARPPGFPSAMSAEIEPAGPVRENVRLVDASGATFARFVFEALEDGGSLRIGEGKMTAELRGRQPRVRYWHPAREFKWTAGLWKFETRVAEHAIGPVGEGAYDDDVDLVGDDSASATSY